MFTYSITIALQDDDGTRYPLPETKAAVVRICREHGDVFTIAQGIGIDTETDSSESVLVIQASAHSLYQLAKVKIKLKNYAASILNQRAVGWFTSEDSYVKADQ